MTLHTKRPFPSPMSFAALRVADVMRRDLVTVLAGDPLPEVERVLAAAEVGGVPVLADDGRPLGVISVRDLLRRHADDHDDSEVSVRGRAAANELDGDGEFDPEAPFERHGDGACAGDVMSAGIVAVTPSTSLVEAAQRMVEASVHRLLVLDRGRLIGIVSTMDVLAAVATGAPEAFATAAQPAT